jgi:hypothetical protein
MGVYRKAIREEASKMGLAGEVDPRHLEAWMRLEWGVLDARTRADVRRFVRETLEIERIEPGASESLAQSYGL